MQETLPLTLSEEQLSAPLEQNEGERGFHRGGICGGGESS